MLKDRIALDLPYYDGLLAGHHRKERGYSLRRADGSDDWLLVATLAGRGRFGSAIGDIPALPKALTLISPGTPHDYGTAKGVGSWDILWVHFQPPPEWLAMLEWPTAAPGIATLEPATTAWTEIERSFRELCRLCFWPGPLRMSLSMNALERLLLLCQEQLPGAGHSMDGRIRRVVEYVHSHLWLPLSLETLSETVHLSPSRFCHLFRAETGMAPLQYIGLQRMQRAASLLERTTLSVGEIAAEVGMEPFHFSSKFKAQTGSSPRAYREARVRKS